MLPNPVLGLPLTSPTELFPIGQEKFLELDPLSFSNPTLSKQLIMEKHDIVESPRKRQKTSDAGPEELAVAGDGAADVPTMTTPVAVPDAQAVKEIEVGITEFVSSDNEGFSGILKKR
jgi:hypothetical protein